MLLTCAACAYIAWKVRKLCFAELCSLRLSCDRHYPMSILSGPTLGFIYFSVDGCMYMYAIIGSIQFDNHFMAACTCQKFLLSFQICYYYFRTKSGWRSIGEFVIFEDIQGSASAQDSVNCARWELLNFVCSVTYNRLRWNICDMTVQIECNIAQYEGLQVKKITIESSENFTWLLFAFLEIEKKKRGHGSCFWVAPISNTGS